MEGKLRPLAARWAAGLLLCVPGLLGQSARAENVGPPLSVAVGPAAEHRPAIAERQGAGEVLLVWEQGAGEAIVGEVRRADGSLKAGGLTLARRGLGVRGVFLPAVAHAAQEDRYLVAWTVLEAGGAASVRARIVEPDGTLRGTERELGGALGSGAPLPVEVAAGQGAGGGALYLALWTGRGGKLEGRFLTTSGPAASALSLAAGRAAAPTFQPAAAWNDREGWFAVAYVTAGNLELVRVEPDGTVSSPQVLSTSGTVRHPALAWNEKGNRHLAVWVEARSLGGSEVVALRLKGDLTASGEALSIQPQAPGIVNPPAPSDPALAAHAPSGDFVVAYATTHLHFRQSPLGPSRLVPSREVVMRRVAPKGVACAEEAVSEDPDGDDEAPALAADRAGGGFLAAWQRSAAGQTDLLARRLRFRTVCNPPRITGRAPAVALLGQPFEYRLAVDDPDADRLTYTLDAAPGGMTLDAAQAILRWQPAAADLGLHPVAVRVDDGTGGTASQSFVLAAAAGALVFGHGRSAGGLDLAVRAEVQRYDAMTELAPGRYQVAGDATVRLGNRVLPFSFQRLEVTVAGLDFAVVDGKVDLRPAPAIDLASLGPDYLAYRIGEARLDREGALAPAMSLVLPSGTLAELTTGSRPLRRLTLKPTLFTQELRFRSAYSAVEAQGWALRAHDLPLRFLPQQGVTFEEQRIALDPALVRYVEKPSFDLDHDPVANDRYLALIDPATGASLWQAAGALFLASGLEARLTLANPAGRSYRPLMPSGVTLTPAAGDLSVSKNRLLAGRLDRGTLTADYGSGGCAAGASTTTLAASFATAAVEPDGALFAETVRQEERHIDWGEYEVERRRDAPVQLYVPGFVAWAEGKDTDGDGASDALDRCPATRQGEAVDGAGCAAGQVAPGPRDRVEHHYTARHGGLDFFPEVPGSGIYPGLNVLAADRLATGLGVPPAAYPLRKALFHLRFGGATGITDVGPVATDLTVYDYRFHLDHFGLAFLDGSPSDSTIDGDLTLPWPSDFALRTTDLALDRCAELTGGEVASPDTPLSLAFWATDFLPSSARFEDTRGTGRRTLFLGMESVRIRHFRDTVALRVPIAADGRAGEDNLGARRLLEGPGGRMAFDGYPFFPEEIRLTPWNGQGLLGAAALNDWGSFELVGELSLRYLGLTGVGLRPKRGQCPDGFHDPGRNGECGEEPTVCAASDMSPGPDLQCGTRDDVLPRNDDTLSLVEVKDKQFGDLLMDHSIKVGETELLALKSGLAYTQPQQENEAGVFTSYDALFKIEGIFNLESSVLITPGSYKWNLGFLADASLYWSLKDFAGYKPEPICPAGGRVFPGPDGMCGGEDDVRRDTAVCPDGAHLPGVDGQCGTIDDPPSQGTPCPAFPGPNRLCGDGDDVATDKTPCPGRTHFPGADESCGTIDDVLAVDGAGIQAFLSDEKLAAFQAEYDQAVYEMGNTLAEELGPEEPASRFQTAVGLIESLPGGSELVGIIRDVRPSGWEELGLGSEPFPDIGIKMAQFAASATFEGEEGEEEVWREIYGEMGFDSSWISFGGSFRMSRFVVDDGVSPEPHLEIEIQARNVPFGFAWADGTRARLIDLALYWDGAISGFEGGLILTSVDLGFANFTDLGAGLGVKWRDPTFYYFWGLAHAQVDAVTLGGGLLVGKTPDLDPLKEIDPLVASMLPVPNLEGFYASFDGSVPVLAELTSTCLLRVNVGGGLGFWVLVDGPILGGKYRAYIFAEVLCLISARGDLTLLGSLDLGGLLDDFSFSGLTDNLALAGTGWIAGGIGFCDPEEWTSPAAVWDDSWCYTCLAYLLAEYVRGELGVDYDAECE